MPWMWCSSCWLTLRELHSRKTEGEQDCTRLRIRLAEDEDTDTQPRQLDLLPLQ
jgi:hypothetical protein